MNTTNTKQTTRLENIATRQRKSRSRDLLFACFIAMVAAIGVTTTVTAIEGASQLSARR